MKKLIITSLLALASSAFAAGTPVGETISNTGLFEYTDTNGAPATVSTTPVNITVAQIYRPSVTPDGTLAAPGQTVTARPGETATLVYQVTNSSNGTDTLNLTVTDATTGNALPATIYLDNNNNGVIDAGDTVVTSLDNLAADATRQVLVQYTVPAGAPGENSTFVNLTATSAGNTGAADSNNVGEITARNIIRYTLEQDRAVTTTAGAAVTTTHVLENTGNATIDAATFIATTSLASSPAVTVSYTVVNSSNSDTNSNASLQQALRDAGDLPAGATYTITVTYTPAANTTNGTVLTNVLTVYTNVTDSSGTDNQVEAAQAVTDTDTVTVNRGVAGVSKVADNCGTDATCTDATQLVLNTPNAKPGDYVRYTVAVTNTGGAGLRFPTLRDYVPAFTEFRSVTGSTTQNAAQVLFSSDRATWNTTAPTTLATSTSATSGPFVYVGLDGSDADTSVSDADELAPGQTMTLVITVRVR